MHIKFFTLVMLITLVYFGLFYVGFIAFFIVAFQSPFSIRHHSIKVFLIYLEPANIARGKLVVDSLEGFPWIACFRRS